MRSEKPKWTTRKYMGDCRQSWAVVDSNYLPTGHRGVIFEYLPNGAIFMCGLNRSQASYYCRVAKRNYK